MEAFKHNNLRLNKRERQNVAGRTAAVRLASARRVWRPRLRDRSCDSVKHPACWTLTTFQPASHQNCRVTAFCQQGDDKINDSQIWLVA